MSEITRHGNTILSATAASTSYMDGPIPGVEKTIFSNVATSHGVVLAAGSYATTTGTNAKRAIFESVGQSLELVGISTGLFGVKNNQGTVLFSTST